MPDKIIVSGPPEPLPEARLRRPALWFLKDAAILRDVGGAMLLHGLFLHTCVVGQLLVYAGASPDDPPMTAVLASLWILFILTASCLITAGMRISSIGLEHGPFIALLGKMAICFTLATALVSASTLAITALSLTAQTVFGWLATGAGIALLLKNRKKRQADRTDSP